MTANPYKVYQAVARRTSIDLLVHMVWRSPRAWRAGVVRSSGLIRFSSYRELAWGIVVETPGGQSSGFNYYPVATAVTACQWRVFRANYTKQGSTRTSLREPAALITQHGAGLLHCPYTKQTYSRLPNFYGKLPTCCAGWANYIHLRLWIQQIVSGN